MMSHTRQTRNVGLEVFKNIPQINNSPSPRRYSGNESVSEKSISLKLDPLYVIHYNSICWGVGKGLRGVIVNTEGTFTILFISELVTLYPTRKPVTCTSSSYGVVLLGTDRR